MTSTPDLRPRAAWGSRRDEAGPPVVVVDDVPAAPSLAESPPAPPAPPASGRRLRRRRASGPAPWPATSLRLLALVVLGFVATVAVLGPLRHGRDQQLLFDAFRQQLAEGTAPVGQLDSQGRLLPLGAPVAVLTVPRLGLDEVVGEGTTSGVLRSGPGHLRSTALPGQAGTAVLLGRQAAYGGPFGDLQSLRDGDEITVQTGQGEHVYEVTGRRLAGDPLPDRLAPGEGRLTLVTATGTPFAPSDVLRVDATLVSDVQPSPQRVLGPAALTPAEAPLAGDSDAWVVVVLLGQALLLAVAGVVWARLRWGRSQAWVVGVPLIGGLGVATADAVARLLPNLL